MAEDKLLKNKKTKDTIEDIYALDLDFDNDIEMGQLSFEREDEEEVVNPNDTKQN